MLAILAETANVGLFDTGHVAAVQGGVALLTVTGVARLFLDDVRHMFHKTKKRSTTHKAHKPRSEGKAHEKARGTHRKNPRD
jgi:hypothetical protein